MRVVVASILAVVLSALLAPEAAWADDAGDEERPRWVVDVGSDSVTVVAQPAHSPSRYCLAQRTMITTETVPPTA